MHALNEFNVQISTTTAHFLAYDHRTTAAATQQHQLAQVGISQCTKTIQYPNAKVKYKLIV